MASPLSAQAFETAKKARLDYLAVVPTELDQQVLVDIDLGILGAREPRFAEYGQQIRDEYAFVPEELFKQRRRAILRSFLERPRIYCTSHFHDRLEERAKANLRRVVGKSAG